VKKACCCGEFGVLVDEVQRLRKQNKPSEHLEQQIDQQIFEMYELTEEEIACIKNN